MDDLSDSSSAAGLAVGTAPQGPAAISATFTRRSLGRVRALVRAAAIDAGIRVRDIDDLLIAVGEIVTNAICYAGGSGSITLRRLAVGLLVEVSDSGPGLPDTSVIAGPPLDDIDAGGLWLARTLSRQFDVVSGPGGVTVRMFMPREDVYSPPGSTHFTYSMT